jgi:hypothetical protein
MTTRMKSICQSAFLTRDSVFIRSDAPLPAWFRFNYVEYDGWKALINVNSLALERTALATGWHFTYVASPIIRSASGISPQGAERRAIKKIMQAVDKAGVNSFETETITSRSLMGLHWVRIIVNPRQFRNDSFPKKPNPNHHPHVAEMSEAIFWRMADVGRQSKRL